jgi:hypothetical protein
LEEDGTVLLFGVNNGREGRQMMVPRREEGKGWKADVRLAADKEQGRERSAQEKA